MESSDPATVRSESKLCRHLRTKVVTTWRVGSVIRRTRDCLDCKLRFDTSEVLIATNGKNRQGVRLFG
jgi:transcriptional regulator NrdR family protein